MTIKNVRCWLAALALATISAPVCAADAGLNLTPPDDLFYTQTANGFGDGAPIYAANAAAPEATAATADDTQLSFTKDSENFEESWLTGSKAHQYLGLGALALVAVAAVSPKEEDSIHEYAATSATVLAAAAATTGFIYHWEDFDWSDGFSDPDNLHMLLAGLGTLAMMYAVSEAPEVDHAGPGIAGGVAMAVAVKITW